MISTPITEVRTCLVIGVDIIDTPVVQIVIVVVAVDAIDVPLSQLGLILHHPDLERGDWFCCDSWCRHYFPPKYLANSFEYLVMLISPGTPRCATPTRRERLLPLQGTGPAG